MENCPICSAPFKTVPAGVSQKTGKPYNAFVACSQRGCPGKPGQAAPPVSTQVARAGIVKDNGNEIRANVALKMVSEIVAAGKIDLVHWEDWANKFYHYKPSQQVVGVQEVAQETGGEVIEPNYV